MVLFEPSDLFLLGPEMRSKEEVFATATTTIAVAVTAVMVGLMALVSTRHVLTSFP
jgi:hypothetical protein